MKGNVVQDLEVHDDALLVQLLTFWTLSIILFFNLTNFSEIELSIGHRQVRFLPEDRGRIESQNHCFK
jgi:hypothetical protein